MLDLWGYVLDTVESGNRDALVGIVDWATKLHIMESYIARRDLTMESPKVALLDLAYHDIRRGRGVHTLLERRGDVERITTDLKIMEAKSVPPQTTRAKVRGDAVRDLEGVPQHKVDWLHVQTAKATVKVKDPFTSVDARVDKRVNEARAAAGLPLIAARR